MADIAACVVAWPNSFPRLFALCFVCDRQRLLQEVSALCSAVNIINLVRNKISDAVELLPLSISSGAEVVC